MADSKELKDLNDDQLKIVFRQSLDEMCAVGKDDAEALQEAVSLFDLVAGVAYERDIAFAQNCETVIAVKENNLAENNLEMPPKVKTWQEIFAHKHRARAGC